MWQLLQLSRMPTAEMKTVLGMAVILVVRVQGWWGGEAERVKVAGGGADEMGFGSSIKGNSNGKSDMAPSTSLVVTICGIVLEVMAMSMWREEKM